MRDTSKLAEKTKQALSVYLQRGEEALLDVALCNDPDGLDGRLKARDAAFHNFRALEDLLRRSGGDITQDAEAQRIVAEAQLVNKQLGRLLTKAMDRLSRSVTKMRDGKKLLAFHSSANGGPRLVIRA